MPRLLSCLLLAACFTLGCGQPPDNRPEVEIPDKVGTSTPKVQPAKKPSNTSDNPTEKPDNLGQGSPFGSEPPAANDKPDEPGEQLPELPKLAEGSEHTPLNEQKTLYLEKAPDGRRRVLFVGEVCLRDGPLEVLVCKHGTKEHESILRTDIDARFLHAALIAAGAKPGAPVQFVDPKTGEPDYQPAKGDKVAVKVHYQRKGKTDTVTAQEWIKDSRSGKPMTHQWVFAGSRFVKHPEDPNAPDYYTANNGEVICISNFPDSMLDLPVEVTMDNEELHFEAWTDKIPPLRSKVWVIMEPAQKEPAPESKK